MHTCLVQAHIPIRRFCFTVVRSTWISTSAIVVVHTYIIVLGIRRRQADTLPWVPLHHPVFIGKVEFIICKWRRLFKQLYCWWIILFVWIGNICCEVADCIGCHRRFIVRPYIERNVLYVLVVLSFYYYLLPTCKQCFKSKLYRCHFRYYFLIGSRCIITFF